MALITCPDCGFQHSDAAPACPKCGRPKENLKTASDEFSKAVTKIKSFVKRQADKPKRTLSILGVFVASIALAPRAIHLGLQIWDPFEVETTQTRIYWKYDGGYTYSRSVNSVASWGVTWSDNSDHVNKQCQRKSQRPPRYIRNFDKEIISAIPQTKNVDGGSCNGTLQTIKIKTRVAGWDRFLDQHCKSVNYWTRSSIFKAQPYLITGPSLLWVPRDRCPQST